MDVREKLVELLSKYFNIGDSYAYNLTKVKSAFACGTVGLDDFEEFDDETVEDIASYLIDNGVTVQEWISVEDRLPEEGEYVLCVLKGFNYGGKIQVCKFVPADKFKDKPYFEHFRNGFPSVTHWMPLPPAPEDMK